MCGRTAHEIVRIIGHRRCHCIGLVQEMMALFITLCDARDVATILATDIEAEARKLAIRIVTLGGQPAQLTVAKAGRT